MKINQMIRAKAGFDRVFDFAAVVCDPDASERLALNYNCGDNLHPNIGSFIFYFDLKGDDDVRQSRKDCGNH